MKFTPSFEQHPSAIPHPFTIEETNHIQMKLMEEYTGEKLEWIEEYSGAFRELIEQEPHLHELYEKDPHACLAYIKKCLEKPTMH